MEGTIATIMMFGAQWAPRSWSTCEGQLLAISSNQALFSILGTNFGGDGRTTFGLPDLRGRVPIGIGQGPGLTRRLIGQRSGQETHTLTQAEMPAHTHAANPGNLQVAMPANNSDGTSDDPTGRVMAKTLITAGGRAGEGKIYADSGNQQMAGGTVSGNLNLSNAGGSQSHNNMQPWLGVNFLICLFGVFPSRN